MYLRYRPRVYTYCACAVFPCTSRRKFLRGMASGWWLGRGKVRATLAVPLAALAFRAEQED